MSKPLPPIITGPCQSGGIKRVDIDLKSMRVKIMFFTGIEWIMTFKDANDRIKVNGVPVIDWYASKNY